MNCTELTAFATILPRTLAAALAASWVHPSVNEGAGDAAEQGAESERGYDGGEDLGGGHLQTCALSSGSRSSC